ncbi:MAG: hypothetical protein LBO69_02350, partial [Ignavibacteria bacterium]|nr:hypothetical protein [Ignavibacteria bacterium]
MKKIITKKNIMITLAIIALTTLTVSNPYVLSQPKEAFEVIYLPIEDTSKEDPIVAPHLPGWPAPHLSYTSFYLSGDYIYLTMELGIGIMNKNTREIKFVAHLRDSFFWIGGPLPPRFRPYSDIVFVADYNNWLLYRVSDGTIEFVDTLNNNLPDTTWHPDPQ